MLERAAEHRGTSFVEVYQNCNIFNDGAFADFAAKEVRADRMLFLEHGKPMIFGKDRDKGIRFNGMQLEVVDDRRDGVTEADILVHDETRDDPTIAFMLSRMDCPEYPVPVGVLRAVQRPTYDALMAEQIDTGDRGGGRRRPARDLPRGRHLDGGVAARSCDLAPNASTTTSKAWTRCENCGHDLYGLDHPESQQAQSAGRSSSTERLRDPGAVAGTRRRRRTRWAWPCG